MGALKSERGYFCHDMGVVSCDVIIDSCCVLSIQSDLPLEKLQDVVEPGRREDINDVLQEEKKGFCPHRLLV